jgi:hypothetical protein
MRDVSGAVTAAQGDLSVWASYQLCWSFSVFNESSCPLLMLWELRVLSLLLLATRPAHQMFRSSFSTARGSAAASLVHTQMKG